MWWGIQLKVSSLSSGIHVFFIFRLIVLAFELAAEKYIMIKKLVWLLKG